MVYKSINGLAPSYLTEVSSWLSDTCERVLSNTKTDLEISWLKSTWGQKCFSFKAANVWNHLNSHLHLPSKSIAPPC